MPDLQEMEQDFWSHVWRCHHRHPCKKCCWPWRKNLRQYGYVSRYRYPGAIAAHKLALILTHGALILPPEGKLFVVCHRCDFPPCCNPSHLFIGTRGDNSRDAKAKGYFAIQRDCSIMLPDGTMLKKDSKIPQQLMPGWGNYLRMAYKLEKDL